MENSLNKEKTNEDIYNKVIEGCNKILQDTHILKNDTYHLKDHLNPTYTNVQNLFDVILRIEKKLDHIDRKISGLEDDIEKLKRK